ncbi:Hypothetical_protein [Hexamita inflata]|uniref:Hypothetical_protein n=1 Tax=Hexamita inflata TaxID=28002 RepID=A0AA86TN29_9EUKA|nr:Hypothetical protein HINF_LOCUS5388 [Hexamita inflata]
MCISIHTQTLNKHKYLALPPGIVYQTVHPNQLLIRKQNSQPLLKSCLTQQLAPSCVIKPLKQMTVSESLTQPEFDTSQSAWSELLQNESDFDADSNNLVEEFSKFNNTSSSANYMLIAHMISQNISGIRHKCERMESLEILLSSHEASVSTLRTRQAALILKLQGHK